MGEKRISTRTLADGYRVTHHPPDDKHPKGKQVLCPGQGRLRERLLAVHDDHRETCRQLRERHHELIARKRASLAANPAVPHSKRCV